MIKISSDVLEYEFQHHINVIGGYKSTGEKSGVYKTALYAVLEAANINSRLKSNIPLVFLDNTTVLPQIHVTNEVCYIIDELNFSPNNFNDFFGKLKKVNGFAIVIGRMKIKQINYSVDAIYVLDNTIPPFKLSKAFVNINKHAYIDNDIYITEDSKSIAEYYTEKTGYSFCAASGKDRIYKYLKHKKSPFVIADNPKFGNILLDIIERRDNLETLDLFLPACFEEFMLSSDFNVDDVKKHIKDNIQLNQVDGETYCESLLLAHCGNIYSKSNISEYINCIKNGIKCGLCDVKIEHSALFTLLLEHLAHKKEYSYIGSKSICYTLFRKDFKKFTEDNSSISNNLFSDINIEKGVKMEEK